MNVTGPEKLDTRTDFACVKIALNGLERVNETLDELLDLLLFDVIILVTNGRIITNLLCGFARSSKKTWYEIIFSKLLHNYSRTQCFVNTPKLCSLQSTTKKTGRKVCD